MERGQIYREDIDVVKSDSIGLTDSPAPLARPILSEGWVLDRKGNPIGDAVVVLERAHRPFSIGFLRILYSSVLQRFRVHFLNG